MKIIVKYECVKGTYENRQKEKIPYETLKLYTLTVNEKDLTWQPNVKENSEYEQAVLCGGARDRARQWVSKESIGEDKKGVQVPVFDVISIKKDRMKELLGVATFEDFAVAFAKKYFLHGVQATYTENDYGTKELYALEVTPGTVLDAIAH